MIMLIDVERQLRIINLLSNKLTKDLIRKNSQLFFWDNFLRVWFNYK